MEEYRDQYSKLFNNGKKVVVIGISTDADTTQGATGRTILVSRSCSLAIRPGRRQAVRLGGWKSRYAQRVRRRTGTAKSPRAS
jgi:hypothetical protein